MPGIQPRQPEEPGPPESRGPRGASGQRGSRAQERSRPFRWDLLRRCARGEVAVLREVARHLRPGAAGPALLSALESTLGAALGEVARFGPPSLRALRGVDVAVGVADSPWAAVRLCRDDGRTAAIVIDGVLCGRLAARTFGAADVELPAPRRATVAERGVLAFLAALALDACGAAGLHVDGVVDEPAELARLFPDPWAVEASTWLRLGAATSGRVRLLVPESLLRAPPVGGLARASASPGQGERLGLATATLPVVVGVAWPRALDIASLAVRDVLLLDHAGVGEGGQGDAWLRVGRGGFAATVAGAEVTVAASFASGPPGPRWIAPHSTPAACQGEDRMTQPPNEALLRELPIEVTCELARLALPAGEVLELGPGAVIPLGRPAGAAVELRAGDRLLARGELVDIEGELGVRILELG